MKERRRSDVERKEFVVSMSKVVGNSYDTETLARWRKTTVASEGEAACGWRNYETVIKSDGQMITDERIRLKKVHTQLHPDLEADTTLEWPFYLQIWWSRDTQKMLIKTEDAVVRDSTVEATPEAVEAFESQFASVQKAIYGNFASSSLPVAPAVRMQQSPARGTQLVPIQAGPAVADDATKKRYEAAKRSLSAAHGNWDRFKREVDVDRPSWGSSENTVGSKLLESFIEKLVSGNDIDGDVLKQEVKLKGLNVNECDINEVETKAKEVTDGMFVLLKDIKKRRDTLNSIAKI